MMKGTVIANPDVVRYIVKRFNLRMSKKWGQNFLIRPVRGQEYSYSRRL